MDLWTRRIHIEETLENLLNNSLDIDIDDEFERLDDIHNTINRRMFDIYRLSTFLIHENNLHKHPPQMLITDATLIAFPGTVLPGQYSSTKSSTILLLFVLTSVETRFLYRSKAVLLQSYKNFPEVPMVQRAALRAIWKGSLGRSPHRPSRPKNRFF